MNSIQILQVICLLVCISQSNAQKEQNCSASSFAINLIYIPSNNDEISVFKINADPSIDLPSAFDDSNDYRTTCLDKRIFKLSKISSPNNVTETKTLERTDPANSLTFKNVEYLTEYQVQSFYTQTFPKGTEYVSNKIGLWTCFGEPSKVNNLKVDVWNTSNLRITWSAPTSIKADRVCYYEIKIFKTNSPSKSFYLQQL